MLLVCSFAVAIGQPLGLRVLALPKADQLPTELCRSEVIKTYDAGFWLEGITVANDGTLYLSGNRNLDFSTPDYFLNATGELIAHPPGGTERIVCRFPKGIAVGMPVTGSDKSIYITGHGETSVIWRIDSSGKLSQLVQFPAHAWPNGLDIGPDGALYTPDSNLGIIWRVNPLNGHLEKLLQDPALQARPFVALAPGANGLHFAGRDCYVTVSDQTKLIRYRLDEKGKLTQPALIASGIPGDDFAIGADGSFFITTHPYNTVVRVSSKGDRSVIAGMDQHIIGATAAAFGKTAQDSSVLYVVTDGGAFTGGPAMKGELVALHPNQK
jgi:sugar lactone lactonase YvrE